MEHHLVHQYRIQITMGYSIRINSLLHFGRFRGQIEHEWIAGISFAMSKKFMREKLKINMGIGEILNRQFVGTIKYSNIDADIISDWSRQMYMLN